MTQVVRDTQSLWGSGSRKHLPQVICSTNIIVSFYHCLPGVIGVCGHQGAVFGPGQHPDEVLHDGAGKEGRARHC